MAQPEEQIQIISKDILALIPKFDGDQNLLKLFIKKVEYVLTNFQGPKNAKQDTYVFHAVTSRLRGNAAALISESDDISNWEQLKEVLIQNFGDPRTEQSLAIDLENLKIKFNESYLEFYRRIQQLRSTLLSKVNSLTNDEAKAEKRIIYNNLALNVFMYNLTEDLFRTVRLKDCDTLEKALKAVTEEVNFQIQYKARKDGFNNPGVRHPTPWNMYNTCPQKFRFGIPQQVQINARPNLGFGASSSNSAQTFGGPSIQASQVLGAPIHSVFGGQPPSNRGTGIIFGASQDSQNKPPAQPSVFKPNTTNSNDSNQPISLTFGMPFQSSTQK